MCTYDDEVIDAHLFNDNVDIEGGNVNGKSIEGKKASGGQPRVVTYLTEFQGIYLRLIKHQ